MGKTLWQHYLDLTQRIQEAALENLGGLAEWEAGRAALHAQFMRSVGLDALPPKTDLAPERLGVVKVAGVRIEKVAYQILPGCYGTGSVFYPDPLPPGQLPAVLYCCGHSPIGVHGYASHGVLWARRGYVCLVFDTIQQAVLKLSGRVPSLPGAAVPSFPPSPDRGPSFSPSPGAGTGRGGGWSFRDESASPEGGNLFARVASELSPVAGTALEEAPAGADGQGRHFRFLGQVASGYLVFETEEGLAVMDPHAAHERIGYERAGRLSAGSVTVQKCALALPVAPSLSVSVREHRDGLEAVGFAFGEQDGQISLTAYPSLPGGMAEDPLRLLRSVLLEWTEDREAALEEILWKKLATIACGLSVKLGDRLTASEALALWRNLLECESPWNCPHGRPTVLSLTAKKLESYFGRE